eukprot:gene5715-6299_t
MSTVLLGVMLFAIASTIHAYDYKYLEVTYYPPNSKCDKSNLLKNETEPMLRFPDSYNIPAFLCLPPAYAYSRDDTYFRCY